MSLIRQRAPNPHRNRSTLDCRREANAAQIFPRDTNRLTGQLVAQLLDAGLPLKTRRQAARALAKAGSEEGMQALKLALQDGPPQLKATIAEALGESPHADARATLIDLLNGKDETTARGALRGFALRGDADAAELLTDVLFNEHQTANLRMEAALSLGEVSDPQAMAALTRAAGQLKDETLLEGILEGLSKRPFAETQDFFQSYLESPNLSSDARRAALGSLANTSGDAASLLLKYAGDRDPEVRAAAAWALSARQGESDMGVQVVGLLQAESSPQVRARLYQALSAQESYDVSAIVGLAQRETDPLARLAGLDVLAANLRGTSDGELLDFFRQTAIPELKHTALNAPDPQERVTAVMTLRRAGTPEALEVLHQVANQSTDRKTGQAAQMALGKGSK
jgi:HEAT repeat protein